LLDRPVSAGLTAFVLDIGERKHLVERFRRSLENTPEALPDNDPNGRLRRGGSRPPGTMSS
jgi:hypothetical protein